MGTVNTTRHKDYVRGSVIALFTILQHLAGHFGGAWQDQQTEFPRFPGPIVVTTNCIIEPRKSYKVRTYVLTSTCT